MKRYIPPLSICFWFVFLGLAFPSLAFAQIQPDFKPPLKIGVTTYPDQISVGKQAWVAVDITLDPGWHIYGNPKGPGPGLPTRLAVTSLPEGVKAEPARFLPAKKLVEAELGPDEWVWIYSGRTIIYQPLTLTGEVAYGTHIP